MVIASHENPDVVREEILGLLSRIFDIPGVEVGTHDVGESYEFIVTVPASDEHDETIRELRSLTAD